MKEKVPIDIGIGEPERKAIADGLAGLLADTFTLYLLTHNFHWNVTGHMFEDLHEMFEDQYNALWQAVDPIAERIRSLGFPVAASYPDFIDLTSVEEADGVPDADEMVRRLVEGHQVVVRTARSMVPAVERVSDQATLDLLTDRLKYHEKTAWMLRSILEDAPAAQPTEFERAKAEMDAATPAP